MCICYTVDRCGSTLAAIDLPQTLSLSNFPANYENNFNCHWIIRPRSIGNQVEVTITVLSTEWCCDHIKVLLSAETVNTKSC